MKTKKLGFKSLFLILALYSTPFQYAQEQSNEPVTLETIPEQIREELEEQITIIRNQTSNIGFVVQQLTQSILAKKINLPLNQTEKVCTNLTEIKAITDLLLKLATQTNLDMMPKSLIFNNVLAKYLLHAVKSSLTIIDLKELQDLIDKKMENDQEVIDSEAFTSMMIENQKIIEELILATDFIGLTWYNKTYRFLKKNNAYELARGAGVVLLTTVALACVYKAYFNANTTNNGQSGLIDNLLNKLGNPGRIKTIEIIDANGSTHLVPDRDPVTGNQLRTAGSGVFKFYDIYEAAERHRLIAATPLITIPIKEIVSSIYYKYWMTAQTKALKRWNDFEAFCLGVEKKQNLGECEKVYFKDMTGAQELEELAKKIANYLLHPERYERTQMEEHRGILLWGPPQTGKTLFVKALKTMIDEQQKIQFFDAKAYMDYYPGATIDEVFMIAKQLSPCILFFDEIDLIAGNREKNPVATRQLLTNMQGIDMASNKIFIIGATNRLEQIDKALLVDGRFGKLIHVPYPEYRQRISYLEMQLAKRNIQLDPLFVNHMVQETAGASYNKLKRLITESLIMSTVALRPVTQADFEKTLDIEIRKIAKFSTQISEDEKKVIATYQAGKALMHHLLQTKKEVVKITTLPVSKNVKANEYGWAIKTEQTNNSDNEKLAEQATEHRSKDGEVFTKTSNTNSMLISDDENKKEAMCLLAGTIAQRIVCHKNYSHCNPQDRAEAMKIIYDLISQGETIDKNMRAEALSIKESYEKEIVKLLTEHKKLLNTIIEILVKQDSIDRYEWSNIIKNA